MAQFIDFLTQQWLLASSLLACIVLFLFNESRRAGASLSPQQAINLVNKEQAVIVDIREAAEFRKGHIVDALNIPFNKLAERKSELSAYKDRPLILVCKMGHTASAAGKLLAGAGFTRVARMSGGMMEWQTMRLPLVK